MPANTVDSRPPRTHWLPERRGDMYGVWDTDARGANPAGEPFEIGMQGLGWFACRRATWPGLNPRLRGSGGEEGYLHEKIRRSGGRVVCHPALRWLHRFERPAGTPYLVRWVDRSATTCSPSMSWDTAGVRSHFRDLLGQQFGRQEADALVDQASTQARNPFTFFDAVWCLNLDSRVDRWERMCRRFTALGIDWLVERVPAVADANPYRVTRARPGRWSPRPNGVVWAPS